MGKFESNLPVCCLNPSPFSLRCFCVFRYQSSDFEEKLPNKQFSRKKTSDYEEKLPNKQFPRQKGDKKQNLVKSAPVKYKGHGNEQNTRESKSCLPSNPTASFKTKKIIKKQSLRSEPRKKQNELSNEGNEKNSLESYWPYLIDSSKVPTASKKAKLDYEKKKSEKKITDMASAFGFEEEDEYGKQGDIQMMKIDYGPFNNYVDKMKGGGGQKMAKFGPHRC